MRLVDVTPLTRGTGSGRQAQVVTAAAQTVGDMFARWWSRFGEEGVGLRGGAFTTTGLDRVKFALHDLAWVHDLHVSGRARWDRTTGDAGATFWLSGAATGRLTLTWNDWDRHARARVDGRVGGTEVHASVPSP
jgi:hypothetical protein